jgi:hypothetical protein
MEQTSLFHVKALHGDQYFQRWLCCWLTCIVKLIFHKNIREKRMTGIDKLVEQHVKEYESRLKHMDELLVRATAAVTPAAPGVSEQLASMIDERDKFASHIDELRAKSLENWQTDHISKSGPMAIWDVVAQEIEKFVERIERK